MPSRPRHLADLTPLRESRDFRRLWAGYTLANLGQQLALVAISLQVYAITGSTFAVGLVGLFALVPLVVLGLYGGSIVDAHDRRRVAVVSSFALWLVSIATAAQAWAGLDSVAVLYALTAFHSAAFAVTSPARSAIVPRLVRRELLPAANALQTASMQVGMTAGPLLAGVLVGTAGYGVAYSVDVVTYTAALWAVLRLPALPPQGQVRRAGFTSVVEGLQYLRTRPNVRMTFLVDIAAMVTSFPRALFPAVAAVVLGGGALTVGVLAGALAVGSVLAGVFSGRLGSVRRQGRAVLVAITCWGASIAAFGVVVVAADGLGPGRWALVAASIALAAAGAADAVSAVFRQTILQAATPDAMRGRLQGVFIVVVAGGPRVGDLVTGSVASLGGEGVAAVIGGLACVVAVWWLARRQPRFARYDAADPRP